MKKLGVLVMALVFILSASVYSFADERVTFNGQFETRAWMKENKGYDKDVDQYYWYQRFRLPVTFNISEAVSAHLRMDISEGKWGQDFTGNDWAVPDNDLAVDRAYIQVAQDLYTLQVGQHWNGAGNYLLWDQQSTGITLNLNLPLNVSLHYSKYDEGNNGTTLYNLTDKDEYNSEDTDFYAMNLGFDEEMWNINALFAMQKDYSDADNSPYVIGAYGAVALDMLTFSAELDVFGGDNARDEDYKGLQGFFDVTYNMNDMFDVGGTFFYAKGYGGDDENQTTGFATGAGAYNPLGFQGKLIWTVYPGGYGAALFDFTGQSAGVVGGALHADATWDQFDAYLRLGYLTPEHDDHIADKTDSLITAYGNIDYHILPSTTLSAGLGAKSIDTDKDNDQTSYEGVAQIRVDW